MTDINQYYEEYWRDPEHYHDPTTPHRQALLRANLRDLADGSRVLDAGCGRGEFCDFFQQMGLRAEGVDISNAAIEFARRQHPQIIFHAGEIQGLLPDLAGQFDCVFSSEVIEHLFDVLGYLRAARALLKPDGKLIVTTPFHGVIKNIVIDLVNYHRHYDPAGQHIRFFDRRGLQRCLEESGFTIERLTGYGRSWPFWKSFFVVARPR